MKFRQNKKRHDPRYFLKERILFTDEGGDYTEIDDAIAAAMEAGQRLPTGWENSITNSIVAQTAAEYAQAAKGNWGVAMSRARKGPSALESGMAPHDPAVRGSHGTTVTKDSDPSYDTKIPVPDAYDPDAYDPDEYEDEYDPDEYEDEYEQVAESQLKQIILEELQQGDNSKEATPTSISADEPSKPKSDGFGSFVKDAKTSALGKGGDVGETPFSTQTAQTNIRKRPGVSNPKSTTGLTYSGKFGDNKKVGWTAGVGMSGAPGAKDTTYGGGVGITFEENINLTKSKLKQIVLEELTKLLLEQETNDKTWVGMNSAQVKKEMAKAGVKYGPGWASKLPKEHPVRAKYREYWKARGANQGASRARPAAGGRGGQTSGRSAGAAKARDLELRRQAGMLDPEGSQLADVRRGGIPGFHGSGLGIGDHEKQEGEKAKPVPKIWALTSRVHQAIEDENKDTHGVIYTWEVKDMMEKNPGMSRQDAITSVVRGKDPAIDALIRSGEIKGLGEKPDAPEESVADSYKKAQQEQEQEQEQVGPPAPEAKKVATGSTETTT
jgi:hypothetical protein